jgi:hypothetical protein
VAEDQLSGIHFDEPPFAVPGGTGEI